MMKAVRWILSLYTALGKKAAGALTAAGILLLFALVISFPLWYLATAHPRLYTILVLSLAGAAILWAVVRNIRSSSSADLLKGGKRLAFILLILLLLYLAVGFATASQLLPALLCLLILLALAGYLIRG